MTLPYPPPYQDLRTLAEHLCLGESTIEAWVKLGKLPPPKVRNGKRLWKWTEVERCLDGDGDGTTPSVDEEAARIREATRAAASERH